MLATTTELLAALEGPFPFALVPYTLYVYVPIATSVSVKGDEEPLPVTPLELVNVYDVALGPNVLAVKVTDIAPASVFVAVPIVGAEGRATDATPRLSLYEFARLVSLDSFFDAIKQFHFHTR
jgi:hypothetical protein